MEPYDPHHTVIQNQKKISYYSGSSQQEGETYFTSFHLTAIRLLGSVASEREHIATINSPLR
jgi:hypothetical protein